jgi:linoleoyl-CoA desaturase
VAQIETLPRVTFEGGGAFFNDIKREVKQHLRETSELERARRRLWLKTAIGFAVLFAAYGVLVFRAATLAGAVTAGATLLFGALLVSVSVLHDANHGAFFKRQRSNLVLGWTVDVFLGFASYAWRFKHNVSHHTYPNIDGYDDDIAHAPFARLAPSQPIRPWYRWQHIYMWPVYGLALLRWHVTDLASLHAKRAAAGQYHPPRGWHLAALLLGKALFVTWALVIPILWGHHTWWQVGLGYLALTTGGSFVMAIVFQLAHAVEEADFVSPREFQAAPRVWAVHEVQSTVDFCQGNRVLTWVIGGLNFQIEHHLFPRLPHTIYPTLAPIVRRVAAEHGVRYTHHPTLKRAVGSHYRYLREMSRLRLPVELEMG